MDSPIASPGPDEKEEKDAKRILSGMAKNMEPTAEETSIPLPLKSTRCTVTDYPAQKKGGRGRRKKGDEIQVMAVLDIKEHFRTLARKEKVRNQEMGTRGVGGTPKRKENAETNSPAKRRKLDFEKLHTFWTGKMKTSDEPFRKRLDQNIIMGKQLITKPCHNQGQSTETSESGSQDEVSD